MALDQKCGLYNWNLINHGKCTHPDKPCCSDEKDGICSNNCTSNKLYDYINIAAEPTQSQSPLPYCSLGSWGVCTDAPKCNGKYDKTFGIQTREYIKTPDCIIPVIQEKTKRLCEQICNSN